MPNIRRTKKIKVANFSGRGIVIANLVGLAIIAALVIALRPNGQSAVVNLPIPPAVEGDSIIYTSSTPVTLIIPAIGVNAKIEQVGKTAGGNMAVPRSFENVGWYKFGAAPGGIGNVVMAGHLDNAAGKPGVFLDLHKLKIGDIITVIGENGEKLDYKVTGTKVVPYHDPGEDVLQDTFGKTGKARLNLITCEGTWVQAKKSYTDRLIVNSELVVSGTRP